MLKIVNLNRDQTVRAMGSDEYLAGLKTSDIRDKQNIRTD